jgi:predicted nucleotidyltransferase component of viral defense system
MAQKQIKNMAASVRERLLQLAKRTERSFDTVLRLYCQERFLYRLSVSAFKNNFILKGGLLFLSLPIPLRRPTVDIDFSGRAVADDHDKLKKVFSEITQIDFIDGIEYHTHLMSIRNIKEGTDFTGCRIIIPAELAKARASLQIDIAFGDAISTSPRPIDFPTLLDFPKPRILAYPIASLIAEKFEAMVSLQTATSRMKDFFDIASLAESLPFEGKELKEAFDKTFSRRGAVRQDCDTVFTAEFAQNPVLLGLWRGFLTRNGLDQAGDFSEIMSKIRKFVEPIVTGTCENKTWDHKKNKWIP